MSSLVSDSTTSWPLAVNHNHGSQQCQPRKHGVLGMASATSVKLAALRTLLMLPLAISITGSVGAEPILQPTNRSKRFNVQPLPRTWPQCRLAASPGQLRSRQKHCNQLYNVPGGEGKQTTETAVDLTHIRPGWCRRWPNRRERNPSRLRSRVPRAQ